MLETGDTAVAAALRAAGLEPLTDVPGCVAAVAVAGSGGYVSVGVARVTPDPHAGGWAEAHPSADGVDGFRIGFHTRLAGWPVERAYGVHLDDVVALVTEWTRWEDTWSVPPAGEPAAKRRRRLQRLAASRLASGDLPVDVDLDPLALALLDAGQATALHAAVEALFRPGLRWRFPRDRTGGKLAGRARVLLHECAPPAHPNGKGIWLVADGPAARAEPRLTVRLAEVVGKGAPHRWDRVPEHWRADATGRSLEELWGFGGTVDASLADEATAALLAARPLDALALCGIVVEDAAARLLAGRPAGWFPDRRWTDLWVTNAVTALTDAAPWRWPAALAPRQRRQRLESLGGGTASNRTGLFLERARGRTVLSFDRSGSPLVLPRALWERDPDLDLLASGLLTRAHIPLP